MAKQTKQRENFGNKFAVIMAMAGSAIGLGNIWRFPYMVGENGGAAFILIYILSSLFLSLPILMSEAIIGRTTQMGTFGSLKLLAPGSKWKWLGLLTVISPLIILSYYSVVGGWSVEYLFKASTFSFSSESIDQAKTMFETFAGSVWGPLSCHTIFLGLCAVIVLAGVKKGIEKFTKITMPLLFFLILVIITYSLSLDGASKGINFMLKPDFSKITQSTIAAAMGQSFFSLSLGVGTILTYSSYVRKNEDLLGSGLGTAAADLVFAIFAGFAVMPAVFAAGLPAEGGPGLVFQTLPCIFAQMGEKVSWLSDVIAIVFFVAILVAALTSAISMYEVGVAYLVEEKKMSRRKATILIFAGTWVLGCLCSLSFGPLRGFTILGQGIFSLCDKLTSNFLMTFGAMLFSIFVGWKMKKDVVWAEFTNNGSRKFNCRCFPVMWFLIRYVAPVVISIIFVTNLIL